MNYGPMVTNGKGFNLSISNQYPLPQPHVWPRSKIASLKIKIKEVLRQYDSKQPIYLLHCITAWCPLPLVLVGPWSVNSSRHLAWGALGRGAQMAGGEDGEGSPAAASRPAREIARLSRTLSAPGCCSGDIPPSLHVTLASTGPSPSFGSYFGGRPWRTCARIRGGVRSLCYNFWMRY